MDDTGDGTFDRAQKFVYDGLNAVLVFDDSGSLTNRMLYGPAVDQFFADEDALGEVLWGLTDNLGTVRDVVEYDAGTDTTTVVNLLTYDSFGNVTSESNASASPSLKFTGRYFDEDVNLQWNWHRWYDPQTALWLSPDPLGFAAGDANLYRYVGNSPTNATDPTGLFEGPPLWVFPDGRVGYAPLGSYPLPPEAISILARPPARALPNTPLVDNLAEALVGEIGPNDPGDFGQLPVAGDMPTYGGNVTQFQMLPIANVIVNSGVVVVATAEIVAGGFLSMSVAVAPARGLMAAERAAIRSAADELTNIYKIRSAAEAVGNYVGPNRRAFLNSSGDLLLESSDGLRQVRFRYE